MGTLSKLFEKGESFYLLLMDDPVKYLPSSYRDISNRPREYHKEPFVHIISTKTNIKGTSDILFWGNRIFYKTNEKSTMATSFTSKLTKIVKQK